MAEIQTTNTSRYNLNELRKNILNMRASDENVINYMGTVMTDEKASPETRQFAIRFFQERQEKESTLSQLVRAIGDVAQRVIGNIR